MVIISQGKVSNMFFIYSCLAIVLSTPWMFVELGRVTTKDTHLSVGDLSVCLSVSVSVSQSVTYPWRMPWKSLFTLETDF